MNSARLCLLIMTVLISFSLSSCVSVSLQKNESQPAKDVIFSEPISPFAEMKLNSADKAWLSKITGNTISYISDCLKNSDPSLEQMMNDSLSVLDNLKVLDQQSKPFNSRSSFFFVAEGSVDGIAVKMKVIVFKKNNCNYTLTYAGVKKNFDGELGYFEKFQSSFTAP